MSSNSESANQPPLAKFIEAERRKARIAARLRHIELKQNVTIIYAVETDRYQWQPAADAAQIDDLRYVFVRPEQMNPQQRHNFSSNMNESAFASITNEYIHNSDDNDDHATENFTGFELVQALHLTAQMNPTLVEMFYAPSVRIHRNDATFALASRVRNIVEEERFGSESRILEAYRILAHFNNKDFLGIGFPSSGRNRMVPLDKYRLAVKLNTVCELLRLGRLPQQLQLTETSESLIGRTLGFDFNAALAELHSNNVLPTRTFNSLVLEEIRATGENGGLVERNSLVDEWLERNLYDMFFFPYSLVFPTRQHKELLAEFGKLLDDLLHAN